MQQRECGESFACRRRCARGGGAARVFSRRRRGAGSARGSARPHLRLWCVQAALTFHLTDGGTQRVVVEENLRCIDLCHLLSLKLNVARSQTWTLVERIGQPRIGE